MAVMYVTLIIFLYFSCKKLPEPSSKCINHLWDNSIGEESKKDI